MPNFTIDAHVLPWASMDPKGIYGKLNGIGVATEPSARLHLIGPPPVAPEANNCHAPH